MKLFRIPGLRHGCLYPLTDIHRTHLCHSKSRTQVHSAAGRIKSMEIPNGPIENRTRDFRETYAFIKYACHTCLGFWAVTQESGSNRDHITGYPLRYDWGSLVYMRVNAEENILKRKTRVSCHILIYAASMIKFPLQWVVCWKIWDSFNMSTLIPRRFVIL
jgi:hypothetical protein